MGILTSIKFSKKSRSFSYARLFIAMCGGVKNLANCENVVDVARAKSFKSDPGNEHFLYENH